MYFFRNIFHCLAWGVIFPVGSSAADRPNILLIFTDDQGYYDVSYNGLEDIETPALDALTPSTVTFDERINHCP